MIYRLLYLLSLTTTNRPSGGLGHVEGNASKSIGEEVCVAEGQLEAVLRVLLRLRVNLHTITRNNILMVGF